MGTIVSGGTTATNPLQYPGSRLLLKQLDLSRWICLVKGTTANNYLIQKSTDAGANWSTYSTIVRANIADIGEIFVDNQGWLFWAYRTNETSADHIMVRRLETGPSNKADTGEFELGSLPNAGVAGAGVSGISVASHFNANGYHYVVVPHGITVGGGNQGLSIVAAQIDPAGNISNATFRLSGTRTWYYPETAGRVGVSVDIEHNGDGYSSSSPNLWITFMRSDLRMVKVPWNGDGWTGSPGTTLIDAGIGTRDTLPALWDGSRFLMAVPDTSSGNTDKVLIYERNRANSSSAIRQTPSHTTGVVRQATIAYDTATGNFRVFAVGTSTAVLYYIDYVRLTNAFGTWTAVSGSPVIIGTNVDNFGVKPNTYGDACYGPYYATGASPFALTYTPQSQSYSPNTPTWDSPVNGDAQSTAATLLLDWTFSDPDPGDTQSKFALSRQVGALAIEYFRTSDGTWQTTEQQNTSSTTSLTLTALQAWSDGLATNASDPNHVYKVKVWDVANNPSAYSAALSIVPSTIVNPAIVTPTAAQVLATDHVTMTWTATEQSQFRVQLNVNAGAQVYDSGWVGDSVSRTFLVPYVLLNSTSWTLTLTTKNIEGLASVAQTRNFTVTYVTPATPTLVATAIPASGIIRVVITNPTPSGGQPVVASQELWRRITGTTTNVRIAYALASGATVDDFKAVSGVAYEYQVVTTGVNGTSTAGAWT